MIKMIHYYPKIYFQFSSFQHFKSCFFKPLAFQKILINSFFLYKDGDISIINEKTNLAFQEVYLMIFNYFSLPKLQFVIQILYHSYYYLFEQFIFVNQYRFYSMRHLYYFQGVYFYLLRQTNVVYSLFLKMFLPRSLFEIYYFIIIHFQKDLKIFI